MATAKILMIDDDKNLISLLKFHFKREGYETLTADNGESGILLARKYKPDLITLDVMLPKMDGLDVLRLLRQETTVPVLFLSGKTNVIDRVVGFRLGADDYLTKPFSPDELLARVKTILNRTASRSKDDGKGPLHIGGIEMDFDRHEIRVNGKYCKLAPREFQLLQVLVEAKGKVLSRANLLEKIWGYDESMDINTRTVDQHIARLRHKLLSEKHRVVTITNNGYQIRMD